MMVARFEGHGKILKTNYQGKRKVKNAEAKKNDNRANQSRELSRRQGQTWYLCIGRCREYGILQR